MAYSVASFSFLSWQSYLLRVNFSSFQPYYKWKLKNTQDWRVQQELQVELSEQAIWKLSTRTWFTRGKDVAQ